MDGLAWIVLIAIAWWVIAQMMKGYNHEEAKKKYLHNLEMLKQDPNNPDLRQATLAMGRYYSNLMRDSKGHTTFDELALKNDIDAACARATVGQRDIVKVNVTNAGVLG